jgi:hypothetical protein
MDCISCAIFNTWQTAALLYADQVTQGLSPLMLPVFGALFTLYWAFRIGAIIAGAEANFAALAKDFLLSCVAGTLLTFPSIWQGLMETFRDTSVAFATWLVTIGQGESADGLNGLLTAIERPTALLLQGSTALVAGTSFYEVAVFLSAAVLWAVYAVLWMLIVVDVIWFFTKFIVIHVFGPLLFVFMALPPVRGIAVQAFRLLVQTILEFGVVGIIIGLAANILRQALTYMPLADGSMQADAKDYVFTSDYLAALFCGALLIFLRSGFKHIAAQLGTVVMDSAPLSTVLRGIRNFRGPAPSGAPASAPTPAPATTPAP